MGTVTQLSVTSGSGFALLNGNQLVSWGLNTYGQLGLDTITSASPGGVPTPTVSPDTLSAIAVSDYSYFQCILNSGIPTCFGQGYSDLPTGITGWSGSAVQLADGDQTCALLSGSTGIVTCWSATSLSPTVVSLPLPATKVVVGYTYGCALLKNGSVWCWGDNSTGELGNGNLGVTNSATPVQVLGW